MFINILRDYYDTFGGDPLNVDYKITDNIVDEYAKLRPYVSHFLGRLYTLQEIFPDYFTDEWIEAYPLFENNEWMYKWYLFLKKNADLKSAFENFDEMKKILRQNFSWI